MLFINSMEASCFSLKCIIVKRIEELVKIVWGSCEYLNQRDIGPPQTLHTRLAAGYTKLAPQSTQALVVRPIGSLGRPQPRFCEDRRLFLIGFFLSSSLFDQVDCIVLANVLINL